ncbi:hypothetical protein GIB67_008126 [Kingdonia uniflora]|uniref:Glycine-rich protein n=1 Tax=Kingdonia uniflora TaxID=39325 RepID=A0A7J7MT42_9MAGN|nr:hypothetical protein GIB67_008126 [Kingdonia uniflora]
MLAVGVCLGLLMINVAIVLVHVNGDMRLVHNTMSNDETKDFGDSSSKELDEDGWVHLDLDLGGDDSVVKNSYFDTTSVHAQGAPAKESETMKLGCMLKGGDVHVQGTPANETETMKVRRRLKGGSGGGRGGGSGGSRGGGGGGRRPKERGYYSGGVFYYYGSHHHRKGGSVKHQPFPSWVTIVVTAILAATFPG